MLEKGKTDKIGPSVPVCLDWLPDQQQDPGRTI